MEKKTELQFKVAGATLGKGIATVTKVAGSGIKAVGKGAEETLKFVAQKSKDGAYSSASHIKTQAQKASDKNLRTSSRIGHGINATAATLGYVIGGVGYGVATSARVVTKSTKYIGVGVRDGSKNLIERAEKNKDKNKANIARGI